MNRILTIVLTLFLSSLSNATEYASIHGDAINIDFDSLTKPTVLIVWASWCGYCMAEIPHLKEEYASHQNLQWLGLNVNKAPADGLEVEIKKSLPWRSISDPDLIVGDRFNVRGTPTLLVLNTQGQVVHKGRRVDADFKAALDSFAL
jgi:thiol-disulfide isomerase/thioredoxin